MYGVNLNMRYSKEDNWLKVMYNEGGVECILDGTITGIACRPRLNTQHEHSVFLEVKHRNSSCLEVYRGENLRDALEAMDSIKKLIDGKLNFYEKE